MTPTAPPFIPETAPFSLEQRAWLNGFLAGMYSGGNGATPQPGGASAPAASAEPLLILFGSQTGTAEGLAKKLAKESATRGFTPKLHPLNDFEAAGFAAAKKTVIISSTWGDGDAPDNAVNFWNWLKADSAPRLESLEFAVLGLGDKNYSDFCGASKKMDTRLEALGARRLAPRGECDTDYEAAAKKWMDGLWEKLGGNSGTGVPPVSSGTNGASVETHAQDARATAPAFSKSHPFPAKLLKNLPLNGDGSAKEVRHYEIALGGSGLAYEVGDALGVLPTNCDALVNEVLAALGATGDEPVVIENVVVPLRLALAQNYELGKPTSELLVAVAGTPVSDPAGSGSTSQRAGSETSAPLAELAALLAPDKADDLKKWLHGRDLLDVLLLAPKAISAAELLPLLRKMSPRLYSISSSPKAHPGEVHLTVGAVRYEKHGRHRKGVASTFLADRAGDVVRVFVQPSHGFRPPANADAPMIMVGPGTGIAPFRAFLEERAATGAKGKNWLFFGDQRRSSDFLYEEQLTAWQKSGFLTRLDLAFSRDQTEKVYVQTRMLENAAELWKWLEEGGHFYVCGDALRMAKDVDAALHKVIETAGSKSADDAKAYVAKMKNDKRYQRDVY
jgi:sulfite reductase (NADPH) flavoprotein alpha-component